MKIRKINIITISIATMIGFMLLSLTTKAMGIDLSQNVSEGIGPDAGRYLGAGLAVGLAGIGASLGMGNASAAAIGAVSENEDLFTSALIFVVLIEAVAIYGLLVALLLIFAA